MLDLCPVHQYYCNRMYGEIGPSLLELPYLNYSDFSENRIRAIPEFIGSLAELKYLSFYNKFISGLIPYQLGNLSKLQYLNFRYNSDMTTDNFEWISHLSSLTYLQMGSTDFANATHWLQSIKLHRSMSTVALYYSEFPEIDPLIVSHVQPSKSLLDLHLSGSKFHFHPSTFPLLFNFSTKLVNLTFEDCSFKGRLPDHFGNMTALANIDISSNELEGGIPKSRGNLCNLKTLYLSSNNLSEPLYNLLLNLTGCTQNSLEILSLDANHLTGTLPDITIFSSLRELNLFGNQLNESFPLSFRFPSKLEILDLDNNLLSRLSFDYSKFSRLKELRVANNILKGTLSKSIADLSSLVMLDVSSNSLSGVISEVHLSTLSKLQYLDLLFNPLALNFSSGWIPPFQLETIKLRSCILGLSFPTWLRTQKSFSYLDMSNSGISDVIADWFWNLSPNLLYLNLSFNHIRGKVPNLAFKFDHYPAIDLSSNKFYGPISLEFSKSAVLNLSKNMFSGSINFLCFAINKTLNYLNLSDNLMYGKLPHCWMGWNNLVIINLKNNNLSGRIPSSIGFLHSIESFCLNNNSLSEEVPPSLKNCRMLKLLDLGENNLSGDMSWIGGTLTSLMVLRLRSNEFSGTIPLDVCHLSSLQILDISLNDIVGEIPSCISNLTAMVKEGSSGQEISYSYIYQYSFWSGEDGWVGKAQGYVDYASTVWKGVEQEYGKTLGLVKIINLSNNKLIGEIPKEVTSLLDLRNLENYLTGVIPTEIGKLKVLEALDLSNNRLLGEISQSMADISFLSYLNLSNNQFSGKIPLSTQLQSFKASSYTGNPELCRLPLLECKESEATQDTKDIKNNIQQSEKWIDMTWFYIGTVSGFIIGFYGVFGTLIFKKSLRFAYFRMLDNMGDRICLTILLMVARLKTRFRI